MNKTYQFSASQAAELDQQDQLAEFREQFHFPLDADGKPVNYFCGHSLGLQSVAARDMVNTAMESWRLQGVDGHFTGGKPWLTYLENLQPMMAQLVGAQPQEVTCMNSLTVNLHLLMASFYRPQGKRSKIVIEKHAFPSDRYAVVSQLQWHGLDPAEHMIEIDAPPGEQLIDEAQVEQLLAERGDEIALLMFPGVQYVTGQFFDLQRLTTAAHQAGAMAGFDLAHAAGNLPMQLHASGADFACWCGYKYLNGGPGTLSGCFVHERHLDRDDVIKLAGWWSNDVDTRFEMREKLDWAKGADAWQVSNPPILSTAPLLTALDIHNRAGMQALRDKAIALTGFLEQGLLALVGEHIEIITPADTAKRGCQLSVRMLAGKDSGQQLYKSLYDHGHICDWRNPDIMRIAPVPLYNSYSDVYRLVDCMQSLLAK